jgi:hypothetical protein
MKVVLGREEGGGGLLWAEAAVWWALWGGGGLVAGGWFTFGYFGYYMGPWGGGECSLYRWAEQSDGVLHQCSLLLLPTADPCAWAFPPIGWWFFGDDSSADCA